MSRLRHELVTGLAGVITAVAGIYRVPAEGGGLETVVQTSSSENRVTVSPFVSP